MSKNYYNILGVEKGASKDEIKKAFRRKAHEHHPDKGGDQEKFKELNEAYQILSDDQKRQQYDQYGQTFEQARAQGGFSGFGGFRDFSDFAEAFRSSGGANNNNFSFEFNDLGDIFGDFFSSAFSTVQAQVEITPAQAVLGEKLTIEAGGERIDLEIPAGIQDGTQFRIRGKGRKMRNGQKGDLILSVQIKMPQRLSKEQRELWEKLREAEAHKKSWWQG